MLSKRVLNKIIIAFFTILILTYPDSSWADRVVLDRTTKFGRIVSITNTTVTIALGCAGNNFQEIKWDDVNEFGGVSFNNECDASYHIGMAGATAAGQGPAAQWFSVIFADGVNLWAEEVNLGKDDVIQLKIAKDKDTLSGPKSGISQISRSTIYVNQIDRASFKWPATFKKMKTK